MTRSIINNTTDEIRPKNFIGQIGTKKFWQPFNDLSEKDNQILRNKGYISIKLESVSYMSKGDFFQKIFGGTDSVALTSSVAYGLGPRAIEAITVQDVTEVKSNRNYILGISRMIAEKVPANTNSLQLNIKMTAVKDDKLKAKFDMLNKKPFQEALALAPTIVGQVLTVSSLVHELLKDTGPQSQLEASFAGLISESVDDHPIISGKLTQGLLFMISADEGNDFSQANAKDFSLVNFTLHYKGNPVENTYVVLRIIFEQFKGEDQLANWSIKYSNALSKLDELVSADDQDTREKILKDAKALWIEGNALIEADASYINAEKIKIKSVAYTAILDKYAQLAPQQQKSVFLPVRDALRNLNRRAGLTALLEALPNTGALVTQKKMTDDDTLLKTLKAEVEHYVSSIGDPDSKFIF